MLSYQSLLEKYIMLTLFSIIKGDDDDHQVYFIPESELERQTGEKIPPRELRQVVHEAASRVTLLPCETGGWIAAPMFPFVAYSNKTLAIKVAPALRPYLLKYKVLHGK